jgi:hypothetical protein
MLQLKARRFKKLSDLTLAVNALAREFYSVLHGCKVSDDFKFYNAHHPIEKTMWLIAVEAYRQIYYAADIPAMVEIGMRQLESEDEE